MPVSYRKMARPLVPGAVAVDLSATAFDRWMQWAGGESDCAIWLAQQTPESFVEAYLIFPKQSKSGAQYGYQVHLLDRLEPNRFCLPPQGVACQPIWTDAGLTVLLSEECYEEDM